MDDFLDQDERLEQEDFEDWQQYEEEEDDAAWNCGIDYDITDYDLLKLFQDKHDLDPGFVTNVPGQKEADWWVAFGKENGIEVWTGPVATDCFGQTIKGYLSIYCLPERQRDLWSLWAKKKGLFQKQTEA